MKLNTQGSAPRAGMLRVMTPRRPIRARLIFATVTGGVVLLTTNAFAQTMPAPPPQFVEQLRQSLGGDSDPMTPVLSGDCNPAEGYTCITIPDTVMVPLSCQVANNATGQQIEYVQASAYRIAMRHAAHVMRGLRRDLDAEIAARQALGHTVSTVSLIQRTALGCTADMNDQACLEQSANYHTYWYEVEPALRAARDAVVDEADAELRSDLTSVHNDVTTLNTRYDDLRRDLTAETTARQAGDSALNARVDELARRRLTVGPFAQFLYIGGPAPGVSWAGGVGGVDVIGRPWRTSNFVGAFRFGLGYGEATDGSRGGLSLDVEAGLGHEWPGTGRVLVTGGFDAIFSTKWRESIMSMTGGLGARGEFDISPGITVYLEAGWRWGNGVNVANGEAIDLSRFRLGGGVRLNLGNW